MHKLPVIGSFYTEYNRLEILRVGHLVSAISVGKDPNSPSMVHKHEPNEDSALICEDGSWALLAVADGHYGGAAHRLINSLADGCQSVPQRVSGLSMLLWNGFPASPQDRSGTTLLVACLDTSTGSGFGFSFGDCMLLTVGATRATLRNAINDCYLHGGTPPPLDATQPFTFQLEPGEGLLMFSDGVNECCYREPHKSVQLSHIQQLFCAAEGDTEKWVRSVTQLALDGVDGEPGGQDNITVLGWIRK